MNNLQPFEKHLADQLQQVPVPNREEGWIEMRKLLDEELPEGGTAWSGNRKWWWMGITVAIIITGLWMSQQIRERQNASANNPVAVKQSAQPDATSAAITEEKKARNITSNNSVSNNQTSNDQTSNTQASKANADHVTNNNQGVAAKPNVGGDNISSNQSHRPAIDAIADNHDNAIASNTSDKNSVVKSELHKKDKSNRAKTGVAFGAAVVSTGKSTGDASFVANANAASTVVANDYNNQQSQTETREESLVAANVSSISASSIFLNDPVNAFFSIPSSYDPLKAVSGKTDKAFAKEIRKESIKSDNRKMSAKEMRGYEREKDHDLTFAAGLALPQSFAISNQQTSSYGVNASTSRVSDYLPVPFFQYHMNSRLFLQTELQFQSPQYTNRLLLYQGQQQFAQTMLERNIFVEKLYYFHIPFNVYFSPARNFYVGSGIQFSSLLSGVATYETNQYNGSTLQNSYSRVEGFKDDSLASKLSSSEWRYQLDANYYLKRFTFGARYNQAFSQFVNIQPSPTLPSTVGRNQSFFVYLRYNIWEERKK